MKLAVSGKRGVFWRANPRGTQELRQAGGGRQRGDWWICWYCSLGHKHRELIGPKAVAEQEAERRRTQSRREAFCPRQQPANRPVLFQDAAKEYLDWSKAHKRSWRTDAHWLDRLRGVFAGKTLDEITPEAIERFKLDLVQSRSKATVNRHLALLRHLFNRRIEDFGHAGRNPVRKRTMFSEQNTRTRWLSPEEESRLLAVIPAPYAAFCRVALYTGARRGELLAARWDQVDTKRGLLTLPTSKSGKPRFIELSSVVLDTLARVPRHLGDPRIFPGCRKVTHRFPAWVEGAQLPGQVTLHTLRHTYASRLVLAGVDLVTIRELGGWSEKGGLALVQRYAHVGEGRKRDAVEALARGERLVRTDSRSETGSGARPEAAVAATA
jgi:integrase